jgi:hypothetical protein
MIALHRMSARRLLALGLDRLQNRTSDLLGMNRFEQEPSFAPFVAPDETRAAGGAYFGATQA